MTGTREIEGSYSYLKDERCYVFWFVKQGQPIFEGQIVGVLLTDKQERQVISSPRDGYITKLYFKEGERVEYKSRGNHALFDYINLPDAVSKGFFDPELSDNFLWEICAPYDSLAHIDEHKRICFSRDGSKGNSTDTAIDISKFKTVSWAEPIYKGDRFVRVGQPILKVMHQYHSNRFAKELKRVEDEQRLKDAVEILKDKEKGLIKQIDAIKREYSQREAERDKAIRATQDAEKTVASAEAKALEIVRSAEQEGQITAAKIVKRLEDEAESRKSSILETARQRRFEATELKKAAELEAAQTIETANIQAQDILAAAQSETDAKRRIFSENAAKMNAGAIVSWLYELKEKGEIPNLMDRPAMRRLYIALGEMLAEAQGYSPPETLAQMENQNRMDEIKAMNYALAKQIRDAEADDFLPDVVRQRMIEQLLDMTEAKGGSIVKKAVDDG